MNMRNRAPRRQTDWIDTIVAVNVASGSQLLQRLTPSGFSPGVTLTRTLLTLELQAQIPGGASGRQNVHWGIGIAAEDAFNANAVPDPQIDSEYPPRGWAVRDFTLVNQETLANGPISPRRVVYDLRGQRKLDNPFASSVPDYVPSPKYLLR